MATEEARKAVHEAQGKRDYANDWPEKQKPVVGTDVPNYGGAAVAAQMRGDPLAPSPARQPTTPSANARQVGGNHYKNDSGFQHWDIVFLLDLDYFTAQATKYLCRAHRKNGVEDYQKAAHYLDKRDELGIQVIVPYEYTGFDGRKHLTHTLLWDFCVRQEMPLRAVRAFFTALSHQYDTARALAHELAKQATV